MDACPEKRAGHQVLRWDCPISRVLGRVPNITYRNRILARSWKSFSWQDSLSAWKSELVTIKTKPINKINYSPIELTAVHTLGPNSTLILFKSWSASSGCWHKAYKVDPDPDINAISDSPCSSNHISYSPNLYISEKLEALDHYKMPPMQWIEEHN